MPKKFNLESKIRAALRNVSRYWPPADEAVRLAKRAPNRYECAHCLNLFPRTEIQRDHIVAVGTLSLDQLTEWAKRLFVDASGYQILCYRCHLTKTLKQKEEGTYVRRKKQLGKS